MGQICSDSGKGQKKIPEARGREPRRVRQQAKAILSQDASVPASVASKSAQSHRHTTKWSTTTAAAALNWCKLLQSITNRTKFCRAPSTKVLHNST